MSDEVLINNWLDKNHLSLADSQINNLLEYANLIKESSKVMNLVSKKDLSILIERHLLDSLFALTAYDIPLNAKAADIGSGAGFPGIPIAIARPDISLDLIEPRRKRSLFLQKAIKCLNLKNVETIHDRWENINHSYDTVFVRAVFKEADLKKKVLSLLPPQSVLIYFAKYNNINILKNN